jgi:hypothetical protein
MYSDTFSSSVYNGGSIMVIISPLAYEHQERLSSSWPGPLQGALIVAAIRANPPGYRRCWNTTWVSNVLKSARQTTHTAQVKAAFPRLMFIRKLDFLEIDSYKKRPLLYYR